MSDLPLPKFPSNRGPVMAGRLRQRQEQARYVAATLQTQLESLDDAAAEVFAVEDERARTRDRMHSLAEQNRTRRGRN